MMLTLLPDRFAVCRLSDSLGVDISRPYTFLSITDDEFSLVCPEQNVPISALQVELGWRAFRICGTLAFTLTGILVGITGVLADAGISLFALSTYNTDYVLVKASSLKAAVAALEAGGYQIV